VATAVMISTKEAKILYEVQAKRAAHEKRDTVKGGRESRESMREKLNGLLRLNKGYLLAGVQKI